VGKKEREEGEERRAEGMVGEGKESTKEGSMKESNKSMESALCMDKAMMERQ